MVCPEFADNYHICKIHEDLVLIVVALFLMVILTLFVVSFAVAWACGFVRPGKSRSSNYAADIAGSKSTVLTNPTVAVNMGYDDRDDVVDTPQTRTSKTSYQEPKANNYYQSQSKVITNKRAVSSGPSGQSGNSGGGGSIGRKGLPDKGGGGRAVEKENVGDRKVRIATSAVIERRSETPSVSSVASSAVASGSSTIVRHDNNTAV